MARAIVAAKNKNMRGGPGKDGDDSGEFRNNSGKGSGHGRKDSQRESREAEDAAQEDNSGSGSSGSGSSGSGSGS